MSDDLRPIIRELIADVLDVDTDVIVDADDLTVLEGWDSLRRLNVMLALEESFDVVMEPEDLEKLTDVDRIVDLVTERRHS